MVGTVTWEDRGLYASFSGLVSAAEIQAFARKGQSDPRYCDLCYVLNDFTNCTGVSYSQAEIEEFAAIDGAAKMSNQRLMVLVVTVRDDVKAMVSKYKDTGLNAFDLKIFPSLLFARKYLETQRCA